MKFIDILGLAAWATVASALAANNGSDIRKLPAKDAIIDCDGYPYVSTRPPLMFVTGPDKYSGTAVTAAAEQAWRMWLKGEKKGHDDNIPDAQYPHNSIPLQFGDHFKNDCDNDADTVIQFPIIGDGVYDGSQEQGMDRVALKDLGDKRSAVFCGLVTERDADEASRGILQYRMC
ncbi:hypothetical protein P168DRAFT_277934 [Aspergillus campestris IBT 28561]|uniref:Uncharacterized protein n=1 Tax=Aspergillus campestris (strain IBT 28561) TaxID=1392248 RepID=A0A2I1DEQ7_ASPC2|nr:uncharacterized protein P168DRAFT_277934 [Aspergillus campestris IBT 28561]PKY08330.1 hypothetical protein P168DRAFT_277934 [Aspergillus campestris IBT 28561]